MNKINFKALIVGALADNVGTLFLMLLLMTALTSQGLSQDEVMMRMKSVSGELLSLIVGLGCTVLGGYISGRMAGRGEVLHGALVAGAGIVVALLLREHSVPSWYDVIGLASMLPAGMLGGRMAQQRRESRTDANGQH